MSLYVVAGSPIAHSLSPIMHNAAFSELGMTSHLYGAVDVGVADAQRVVCLMRSGKIAGANITHPLKTAIVGLIDGTSGDAGIIGAANTLVPTEDGIIGLSTDGQGCLRALEEKGVCVTGANVLIIGAGGAARSIAVALSRESPGIIRIANRTVANAIALAGTIDAFSQSEGGGLEAVRRWSADADIIIQASSMGMHPHGNSPQLPWGALEHRPAVMDIVYNPLETALLKKATEAGCPTIDGIDLLVWQGALSFKEWHGVLPPVDVMRTAARSRAEMMQ